MGIIERKWALSYIAVIFCCVIVICSVIALLGVRMVTSESKENLVISSQKLADAIDQKNEYIKQIAIKLSLSDWMGYLSSPTLMSREYQNNITDQYVSAVVELNGHCNVEPSIGNITIFFTATNQVINCKGNFTNEEYFKIQMKYDEALYEKLLGISETNQYFEYINYTRNKEPVLLLVYNASENAAIIVIEINASEVEKSINKGNVGTKYEYLLIQDTRDKQIIFRNSNADRSEITNWNLREDVNYYEVSDDISSINIKSGGMPYQYYFMYTSDYVTGNGKLILEFIFLAAVISIILGVILSTVLISINYKPFQSMLYQIGEIYGEKWNDRDEYAYINKSLTRWSKDTELTKEYSEKYKKAMWSKLLIGILTGYIMPTDNNAKRISDNLLEYDDTNDYLVILFNVLNTNKGNELFSGIQPPPLMDHIVCCIESAAKAEKNLDLWQNIEINTQKYAAIFRSKPPFHKDECTLVKSVRDAVHEEFGNSIACAEGEWRKGIVGISVSFQLAEKIYAWQMFTENFSSDGANRYKEKGLHHYFFPHDWENKLVFEAIKGNETGVKQVLNNIFDENNQNKNLSVPMKKQLFERLIETAYVILEKLNRTEYETVTSLEENINHMSEKQILASIKELYAAICVLGLNNQIKTSENRVFHEIIDYVSDNYTNYNISLKDISSKFDIPEYTISKMFKTITGFNFLDYLNKKRIDESKTILQRTEEPIYQIAIRIGFDSDRSFRRVFKKYVGCGPLEYRNFAKNEDNGRNCPHN